MRGINGKFIKDLQTGELSFFLSRVKSNRKELALEIRNGYVNIYYKGGNLLKITQKKNGYSFHFDAKYCLNKGDGKNFDLLNSLSSDDRLAYVDNFDLMMREMDTWFKAHPKAERDFQHELLLNNPSVIDIEYQAPYMEDGKRRWMRLDMLMVIGDKLIIAENKYGVGAVSGDAGVGKHYKDIVCLLNDSALYDDLTESVKGISSAKFELGLSTYKTDSIDKAKTEILFLFADYNDRSERLKNELKEISVSTNIKILMMNKNEYVIDLSRAKDYREYVLEN